MHAQQHEGSGFADRMDASGMRQSPVPTDNVPPAEADLVPSLSPLTVGNFNPAETTMGRIIDSMQAPIGSLAAGNAQHRGIVDAELGPGSRFSY